MRDKLVLWLERAAVRLELVVAVMVIGWGVVAVVFIQWLKNHL